MDHDPPAYGGPGGSVLDVLLVVEDVASVVSRRGSWSREPRRRGRAHRLRDGGAEAALPWVLEGEKPAIAITEPEAGSPPPTS